MLTTRRLVAAATAAAVLFVAPAAAHAAVVANGDFETGTLSGWQQITSGPGDWNAYTGTAVEMWPVPAPPQGTHAAITVQEEVSNQILYQDITLPPGSTQAVLSMLVYYRSYAPIASPNILSVAGPVANQQYRVDVMGGGFSPITMNGIRRTVFRTVAGDPTTLEPTLKTADLSAFAGDTLRLRLAVASTEDELNAGADAISVKSNAFSFGKPTFNKKKGTAALPVTVADAGTLTVTGSGMKSNLAAASKSFAVSPGTENLRIKAKGKKRAKLNDAGKVKLKVKIAYAPTGLKANVKKKKLFLKKKL